MELQKTTILYSARILQNVLEVWGDLLTQNLKKFNNWSKTYSVCNSNIIITIVVVVVIVVVVLVMVVEVVWISLMLYFLCPTATKSRPNATSLPSCYSVFPKNTSWTLLFLSVALMLHLEITLAPTLHFSWALMLPIVPLLICTISMS